MRTKIICTGLAVAGLVATGGSAQAAAPKFSYTTSGLSGAAWFTDFPGQPEAGTVYHDTLVNAGYSATKDDGTKSDGSWAYVQTFSYSFDQSGSWTLVGQTTGYADGASVTFAADKKLSTATLSAAVPFTTCDADGNCVDDGTRTVTTAWTGVGDVSRSDSRSTEHDGCTTTTMRSKGSQRAASASSSPFGDASQALLSDGSFSQRTMWSHC